MTDQNGFPVPKANGRHNHFVLDTIGCVMRPDVPDYESWTDSQLKDGLNSRRAELPKPWSSIRCVEILVALHHSHSEKEKDRQDRISFDTGLDETWELPVASLEIEDWLVRPVLSTRQKRMFASTYVEDASRMTFLDLPGEIRNMIYAYALFDSSHTPWELTVGETAEWKISARIRKRGSWRYQKKLTIATLDLLGATSKAIRREVRALFWARLDFSIVTTDPSQHNALCNFLQLLRPDARAALTTLCISSSHLLEGSRGYTALHKLLPMLHTYTNLRSVNLQLYLSNIFHSNLEALEEYFMSGKALVDTGLEALATTIESLPLLTTVNLLLLDCEEYIMFPGSSEARFLRFSFTGMRGIMLWKEILERLQDNHLKAGQDEPSANLTARPAY